MSQSLGNCKTVTFAACAEIAPELENFAEDFFEVVEINYTDDGEEQLIGYMRQNVDEAQMIAAAKVWNIELPSYQISVLEAKNWLKENVIKFAPVETDDFVIYGIFEKNIDTHGKIGIKIYAATAFGSEHQTTVSCLNGISDINRLLPAAPQKVLDVGTGSGILALAAAKLWRKAEIVAVDIDDESVRVTAQNALDNDVSGQITAAYSDGYNSEIVRQNAPYDVVFANILARPLIAMAPDMAKSLRIGGYAVISGFIDEQVEWVVGEHEKYGLALQKIYAKDGWRAALLKRIK
ncbi:MAG: 50S ribosomal protein L11 methyltransferase [Alphaproteobacteria bacterium]|nr:50S ribosomal protein L11 methyltransferase [Alphaproteobacteria bacterium]